MKKFIAAAVIIAVLSGAYVFFIEGKSSDAPRRDYHLPRLVFSAPDLGELRKEKACALLIERGTRGGQRSSLSSYKCRYKSIVCRDRALKINKNVKGYSIVRFKGVITGGIADVSQITIEPSPDGEGVAVSIPPCQILDNVIEEEEEVASGSVAGLFLRVQLSDVLSSIDEERLAVSEDLIKGGFLEDADSYARETIAQMMMAVGFKNVEVNVLKREGSAEVSS